MAGTVRAVDTEVRSTTKAHLQHAGQLGRDQQLAHDGLPLLGQAGGAQLEALLHHVAAELLLGQLRVLPAELAHDGRSRLGVPQLQHVLHHVVAEGVLRVRSSSGWALGQRVRQVPAIRALHMCPGGGLQPAASGKVGRQSGLSLEAWAMLWMQGGVTALIELMLYVQMSVAPEGSSAAPRHAGLGLHQ